MPFHVYAGDACWVLVPDFLQPPIAASRYRPLVRRGELDDEFFDAGELDELNASMALACYAIAPAPLGERLRSRFGTVGEPA